MVKDLDRSDREKLNATIMARPVVGEPDEDAPPSWWHGEEEASRTAAAALGAPPGVRRR